MNKTRVLLFSALLGSFLLTSRAEAQVPRLIRYQGMLKDSQGVPLQGPYKLTFRLYAAATAGAAVWTEPQMSVPIDGGNFSVLLGQVTPLDAMNWSAPSWMSIQVNDDPELAPRQQITSVPLAIRAEVAEMAQMATVAQSAQNMKTSSIQDDVNRLVPSGAIILWMAATCPAGYTRVSTMDGKFLVSGSTFNAAAGGSNTHSHGAGSYTGPSHTHTVPHTGWGFSAQNDTPGIPYTKMDLAHQQATVDVTTSSGGTGSVTGTSASADSRPEFATVLLCQKD